MNVITRNKVIDQIVLDKIYHKAMGVWSIDQTVKSEHKNTGRDVRFINHSPKGM